MLTFLIFLNNTMKVISGIKEEMQRLSPRNSVTIKFYNRCFCSRTKIEQFILRLSKQDFVYNISV